MLVERAGDTFRHRIGGEDVIGGVDGARHLPCEDVAIAVGDAVVRTLGIG